MSTTTTTPSPAVAELMASRQALIDRYLADGREAQEHRAHGRKALAAKAEGRMSNRSHEIRGVETELETLLVCGDATADVKPWEKPASARARVSRVQPWTPADAERLSKLGLVYKSTKKETVKDNADSQIQALLQRAKKLSVQVKDPRK